MKEEWRDVPQYKGLYQVSNLGHVRSLDRAVRSVNRWGPTLLKRKGQPLKLLVNQGGYLKVLLSKDGKIKNKLVSTLVAAAFIGPRPEGLLTLHTDGNAWNNRVSNLRYGTQADNMRDSMLHGTRPKGRAHKCAKLTEQQVLDIRASTKPNTFIASIYGVDPSTIGLIKRRKTWKHLP